jgi:hypothetical protein
LRDDRHEVERPALLESRVEPSIFAKAESLQ